LIQIEGRKQAQSVHALANELDIPHLADLVSQFLVGQLYLDMDPMLGSDESKGERDEQVIAEEEEGQPAED
jgi:hypothetical protein